MSARNTFAATRRSHAILRWLRDGETVSITRVSEAFGIQYPQAREDLKLLEELYGLETLREGRTKVWAWAGENPTDMGVSAAAALELGGIAMDIFRDTPHGKEITRLTEYCRKYVGHGHRERLDRLSSALHLRRTWLPTQPEKIVEHLEDILDAIGNEHQVHFIYERSDGEVGTYRITPKRLVWYNGRLWLLGLDSEKIKLFDVAGIDELERKIPAKKTTKKSKESKQHTQQPPQDSAITYSDDDPRVHFQHAFGIYAENYPVETVHLEVRGAWANYLKRYHLHPSQKNKKKRKKLHVTFELGLCPEFKSFVLGMIPDVTVHAPLSLAQELEQRASQWVTKGK